MYKPQPVSLSFWDNIRSYGNPSIWQNLQCHGDRSWIWQGLCSGTSVSVHDGLYMKEVSPVVCSAAVIIYCVSTGSSCKCTIAEKLPSSGSYHGEILGTILTQLILRAAVQGHMGPYLVIIEDCDNNGMVKHGNAPHQTISLMQTQSDVLRVRCGACIRGTKTLKTLHFKIFLVDRLRVVSRYFWLNRCLIEINRLNVNPLV